MMPDSIMTQRERIAATIRGGQVDRLPVVLWRHFPLDDQSPESLAAATLAFQRTYDWDIVKVTPASSFCLRDWGVEDEWRGHPEGRRTYTRRVVQAPSDWERLPVLGPDAPHLAAQLRCLRLIQRDLSPHVPLLQTVFSPLAQAKNLAGADILQLHLQRYPSAVLAGLNIIARSTAAFVEALAEMKIDGIFYAVQYAEAGLLDEAGYQHVGFPADTCVLAPARGLWCNMLHLHGRRVHFALAQQYGLPIVNWHDRDGLPTLRAARSLFDGVACGGLRLDSLSATTPDTLLADAANAVTQFHGRQLILGAGCVTPLAATHANLMALRNSVTNLHKSAAYYELS